MPRLVRFHHDEGPAFAHQFANFGEDVWLEFQSEPAFDLSLEDIDGLADAFILRVKPSRVSEVLRRVEPIMKSHNVKGRVEITVMKP